MKFFRTQIRYINLSCIDFFNSSWYVFWLAALGLLLIKIFWPLTSRNMFLDGVFYASIAKNLSQGYGTLWRPIYSTETLVFYEHPPLAIYFQSLFFKILGSGFGVEQFYSFLMACGQFALISWYWLKKSQAPILSLGLLLFFWLVIPLNQKYVDNMLEGTLTLFTTFASLVLLIKSKTFKQLFLKYLLCALAILVAFFCNGPVAFFPLIVPFLDNIVNENNYTKGLKQSFILTSIVILFLTIFYIAVPDAWINTQQYLQHQLFPAIQGKRSPKFTGFRHFNIFLLYLRAYGLVSCFGLLILSIAAKISSQKFNLFAKKQFKNKNFLIFFILSLVSSLPVGISAKQALSYLIPSAPFFSLAIMFLCYQPCKTILDHYCHTKIFKFIKLFSNLFLLICLLGFFLLKNGFNKHEAMIHDIDNLIKYLPNETVISVSPNIFYQWYTSAYFARNSRISVIANSENRFYLALKNESIPENYHLLNNLSLSYYKLAIKEN